MFEAAILVITLKSGAIMFEDTRGPYSTIEACEERVVEMETFVRTRLKRFAIADIKTRCKNNGDMGV